MEVATLAAAQGRRRALGSRLSCPPISHLFTSTPHLPFKLMIMAACCDAAAQY